MPHPHLLLDDIHVAYTVSGGAQAVVKGLSLALSQGRIGCLLGASGCGKTTVLRAIGGFETLSAGRILLDGQTVSSPSSTVPPEARHVGVVFQDYALFPHLSAADNIGFGLRRWRDAERRARINAMAQLVGLAGSLRKYPHELSGGQQQRVALARALAPSPALLLLDEPFSSLDLDLRERLAIEVRDILKSSGTTALLVTHDQFEAFATADAVGVMDSGTLAQWDTPYQLYHRPATHFVADFVGRGTLLPAERTTQNGQPAVSIELGTLPLPAHGNHDGPNDGVALDVLLRADDIVHDDASPLTAQVVRKAFHGADFLYTLKLASGRQVFAYVPSHHDHPEGSRIGIRLAARHGVAFPRRADG